jgi:hypothetical protein
MAGGIIFTANGVQLRDQFGCRVICTRCGEDNFDITLGPAGQERVECSNSDCGMPVAESRAADQSATGR